jgi:hypothetical protein
MTQTSNLKSAAITNLDATPIVANTTGEGAPAYLKSVVGFVTTVSADAAGSTYRLVRLPSNAKVKEIFMCAGAMTAGAFNLSVYYSDSTTDGTAPANQGLIVSGSPGGDAFFGSDISAASALNDANETNESGNYPLSLRNQPLWQALGLATDPGGFLDIVAVCHTTAVTTGALLGITVLFDL